MAAPTFGDNTTHFQRVATIPMGGLKIEAGCYTAADSTVFRIPTTFTSVVAIVINGDTSLFVMSIPDISGSFITADVAATASGEIVNYIAVGW